MRKRKSFKTISLVALMVCAAGLPLQAQTTEVGTALSLKEAVALALGHSPERRLGQLGAAEARAEQGAARSSLLPQIGFSESATRGDDPVYVFGTLLHQQQFTQADFALNSLNRPQPLGDFTTKFAGSWTAFDSWQSELRVRSAGLMAKSAEATSSRSDQTVIHNVVAQYEGVLLAARQAEVAAHEVETAKSLANDGDARMAAGMAVESDRLSAAANLAQRQEEQIAAQGGLAVAWAELVRAMGVIVEEPQQMPKSSEASGFELPVLADAVAAAQQSRPDRQSAAMEQAASKTMEHAALAAMGPSVNTFGSWQMDRQTMAGSAGNSWMAGAELRINLLPAGEREQYTAAKIRSEQARAVAEAVDNRIRAEVTRAWYAAQTAQQTVEVARRSMQQTAESLRILRDRYAAGLATMTDLLRAEDADRQSTANYWQAVSRLRVARADLLYAMGSLNPETVEELQ